MKKFFRVFIPILLALAVLLCLFWYLAVYDRAFTRDMLLYSARFFDGNNKPGIAAWFYDKAYDQSVDSDEVAIELATQHKADGNYTQAEVILSKAIEEGASVDLYIALSKTYVEQDKILDAVKLLGGITNPDILKDLDPLRPAAPTASPEPGFYNQYISVTVTGYGGTLFVSPTGEYPSVYDDPYAEPIPLSDGENTIYAVSVADNGLVSPLSIFGYTVGGVIEEAIFADAAVEAQVRQLLGVEEDVTLMSNQLWDITSFTMPAEATSFADLKYMPFLEELVIANGPKNELDSLSSLVNLSTLAITDTPVSEEELEIIGTLTKLRSLTLSGCGLSTAAPIENLTNLTYLDLSNNTIRNIQPLAALTKLTEAHLQHNALTDLTSLSGLSSIVKLDVSYNALTSLTPISNITGLVWLDATYNTLTDLVGAEKLTLLQYLSVSQNSITDVSPLAACTSITELNLSNNAITDISAVVSMVNMVKLNFANNQVTELPAFAADCALVTIDGSHNLLKKLDPLSGLEALNNIYMDYNEEISSVKCLANCPVLILVNVYGTKVTEVKMLTDQSIIVNYDPTQERP